MSPFMGKLFDSDKEGTENWRQWVKQDAVVGTGFSMTKPLAIVVYKDRQHGYGSGKPSNSSHVDHLSCFLKPCALERVFGAPTPSCAIAPLGGHARFPATEKLTLFLLLNSC